MSEASQAREQPDLCVLLTTCEDRGSARRLADGLVAEGLAACVQLSAIDSVYVWEGRAVSEPEVRVMVKTRRALRDAAMAWIATHHDYDVPQLVALDAAAVNPGYQDWLESVTRTC